MVKGVQRQEERKPAGSVTVPLKKNVGRTLHIQSGLHLGTEGPVMMPHVSSVPSLHSMSGHYRNEYNAVGDRPLHA